MAYYSHQFKQGEDYFIDIDLKDDHGALIDTTGWVGASGIQTLDGERILDADLQPIAFTVTFPQTGTVRLSLPYTKTLLMPAKRYLTDARLTDALGKRAFYLEGDVIVRRAYTP